MKNISLLFVIVIAFSACGTSQQWPPKPALIRLGEDACAHCRMIISEEHYGAQLYERGKPVAKFDDYGCLLIRRSPDDSNQRVIYVRSFEDASWLHEEQAFFVVSKNISSPMGYGIAAFPAKESAARFAQGLDDSKIYSFSELIPAADQIVCAASPTKE